jgi:hypothetical protein
MVTYFCSLFISHARSMADLSVCFQKQSLQYCMWHTTVPHCWSLPTLSWRSQHHNLKHHCIIEDRIAVITCEWPSLKFGFFTLPLASEQKPWCSKTTPHSTKHNTTQHSAMNQTWNSKNTNSRTSMVSQHLTDTTDTANIEDYKIKKYLSLHWQTITWS